MNEQVERRLDAEAASDSRGYVTERPFNQILTAADGADGAAAAAAAAAAGTIGSSASPPAGVVVESQSGLDDLLRQLRSLPR